MAGKIFVTAFPYHAMRHGDVLGCALAEDGHALAEHLSSNLDFAKHDMGLTSDWQHEKYRAHYPNGYELVWVEDRKTHPGWLAAMTLNRALESAASTT